MITLVIPDLHHKVGWVNDFIDEINPDEIATLGDYFDDKDDDFTHAAETAEWLRSFLYRYGNRLVPLMGNHDIAYRFPGNFHLQFKGWSGKKAAAINRILTPEDWSRLKLMHYTQGFLLTHAGVSDGLFRFEPEVDGLYKYCNAAMEYAAVGAMVDIIDAGTDRGGRSQVGGLLWCDYKNFKPVKGINQIFGHTCAGEVRIRKGEDSINYCIDTNAQHAAIIEDGAVTIIETGCPYKGNNFMKGIPAYMGDTELKEWVDTLQKK